MDINNEIPKDALTIEPQKKERLVTGSKAGDFMIGFFGTWLFFALLSPFFYFFNIIFDFNSLGPTLKYIINLITYLICPVIMLFSFSFRYKHLGFGILFAILIPLLLFGGCMVLMNGF